MDKLASTLSRHVTAIFVTPLFGVSQEFDTPSKALQFLLATPDTTSGAEIPLGKIDIIIRYNNGDIIQSTFQQRETACHFIKHITA